MGEETELERARRHVLEGEQRVSRQSVLIADMERSGPSPSVVLAREVLSTMEESLRLFRDDLRRIEAR